MSSCKELGLVEPLVVVKVKGQKGIYNLINGHLRFTALKEVRKIKALCMVSTDDEGVCANSLISLFVTEGDRRESPVEMTLIPLINSSAGVRWAIPHRPRRLAPRAKTTSEDHSGPIQHPDWRPIR